MKFRNVEEIKAESCKIYNQTHNLQKRDEFVIKEISALKKHRERPLEEVIDRERGDKYVWEKIFGSDAHQAEKDLLGVK